MTTTANDSLTLERIVKDLDTSFIVEAGAGAGKTYALCSRVVALVKAGVSMKDIVAITFTEAMAAELSERIRSRMEQLLDDDHPANADDLLAQDLTDQTRGLIRRAIAELDQSRHPDHPQLRRAIAAGTTIGPLTCLPVGRCWTRWSRRGASPKGGTNGWSGHWVRVLARTVTCRTRCVIWSRKK